jgi:hypothetical protein
LLAVLGTGLSMSTGAFVTNAVAAATPAPFTYCPLADPNISYCVSAVGIAGGSFKMGSVTVSIPAGTNLQGGLVPDPVTGVSLGPFIPASPPDKTLTSPALGVPGGLLGVAQIQDLLPGVTDVKAEVKLVGPVTFSFDNLLYQRTPGIALPVEVHLVNATLGPNCTIGTPANPIILNLTDGVTSPPAGVKPIRGSSGAINFPKPGFFYFKGVSVVDNTWAAPGATGCGLFGTLNALVNFKSGLPSAAGNNIAILNSDSYLVDSRLVFADAPYPGY